MINNITQANSIQNNPQQNNNAKQLSNIQTTLSQLQSAPDFQAKTTSSPLLQNLLQLIKNILEQLNQEPKEQKKQEPNPNKENPNKPKQQENPKPSLKEADFTGTEGDDNLEGDRNNNQMFGLGGNDSLKGRQGNDFIDGGAGQDHLYGGSGDDTLRGGRGNDYLSGGSGNNKLFGGAGDDILASRQGTNDLLDGGSGTDTARIRGNIDNYSLQLTNNVFPRGAAPNDDGIVLTHKTTGQTITAINTENFRFNDASLSFDEMKERADPISKAPIEKEANIKLTPNETKGLYSLFETKPHAENRIEVADKDGSGTISVGDIATLTNNRADPGVTVKILTAADVEAIQGNNNPLLDISNGLSDTQKARLSQAIIPQDVDFVGAASPSFGGVVDKNNDGKLSVGDGVIIEHYNFKTGSYDPKESPLTQVELDRYIAGEPNNLAPPQNKEENIKLTPNETKGLYSLFENKPHAENRIKVADKDGSGTISVGDIATLTDNRADPDDKIKILTAADVDAINNVTVPVTTDTQKSLDENKQKWADSGIKNYSYEFKRYESTPFTQLIKTTVENGEVKTSTFADKKFGGEVTHEPNIKSVNDLFDDIQQSINSGKQVEVTYDSKTGMPTTIVFDGDRSSLDISSTITLSNLQDLDTNKQQPNDTEVILSSKQDQALRERFDVSGLHSITITDKDGNSELSAGDVLEIKGRVYYPDVIREDGKDFGEGLPEFAVLKTITLSEEDVAAINNSSSTSTFSLEEKLEYLDGKSFKSEELLETGLIYNGGVGLGHWNIYFNDGKFGWDHSDVKEGGATYGISDNNLSVTNSRDKTTTFEVFPDQNAVEFEGERYILLDSGEMTAHGRSNT